MAFYCKMYFHNLFYLFWKNYFFSSIEKVCYELSLFCVNLTVDLLDALQIVMWQSEVLGVHVLVEGGHDSSGVVGVLQA